MPYRYVQDLPDRVRKHLPQHAQEIYLEAFNHAYEEYKPEEKRKTDASLEEVAHRTAWAAVKKKYRKSESGDWVEKK